MERQPVRGPQIPRWQKVPLAALARRLQQVAHQGRTALADRGRLFQPATLIGWHRELVQRTWTIQPPCPAGPPVTEEVEQWIVRIARENPGLGYEKLEGKLRKLGFQVSKTTIGTVLQRHGILPTPERRRQSSSWRTFLNHYQHQCLACDFFTVETVGFATLYVLFFIEHATRRVYLACCTAHPHEAWVVQQARQMTWALEGREMPIHYLIHDHDTKFTTAFDTVFASSRVEIIPPPFQAPNANALAERWGRSVREECLDPVIILSEWHLRQVLKEYVSYYNARRPHQGLPQASPLGLEVITKGPIQRRAVLGGIIQDYYRQVA